MGLSNSNKQDCQAIIHSFPKHCETSVKDLVAPADIKTISKNSHLISNCTEIKAERFVKI
jgi:hypothetical protein